MGRAHQRAQRSDPLRELEEALVDRTRARYALVESLQWLHGLRPTTRSKDELEEEVERRLAAVHEIEERVNEIVASYSCEEEDDPEP